MLNVDHGNLVIIYRFRSPLCRLLCKPYFITNAVVYYVFIKVIKYNTNLMCIVASNTTFIYTGEWIHAYIYILVPLMLIIKYISDGLPYADFKLMELR